MGWVALWRISLLLGCIPSDNLSDIPHPYNYSNTRLRSRIRFKTIHSRDYLIIKSCSSQSYLRWLSVETVPICKSYEYPV